MVDGQADLRAPSRPVASTARARGASGSVGLLLDGRYRLLQRRTRDEASSTWDAEDDQLQRPVAVRVVAGASAALAVDAARRSAAVEDERLPRVLDIGSSRATDGSALAWVVTERSPGRSLAELLREAPLPATRVRAVVGEAASVLARAAEAGLHHRRLDPDCVLVTGDGATTVLGLEVAAAAAGLPPTTPEAAEREDAVGLVRLLYAGLTGLWPGGRHGALGAAPLTGAGVAAPPGQLVPGVPNDLDTLAVVTLGPYDDGPLGPAELAAQLAPWGSASGPVTADKLGVARPREAAADAGEQPGATAPLPPPPPRPAAPRARLGGGPGAAPAAPAAPARAERRPAPAEPPASAAAAAAPEPVAPAPAAAETAGETAVLADAPTRRSLRRPTVALPPGGPGAGTADGLAGAGQAGQGDQAGQTDQTDQTDQAAQPTVVVPPGARRAPVTARTRAVLQTRAARRAAERRAERETAARESGPDAFDALVGSLAGREERAAPPAERPAAPARAGAHRTTAFDDTDATDWVSAGWGPAAAAPAARTPRAGASAVDAAVHDDGRAPRRRGPAVLVGVLVVLLLAGLLVASAAHLAGLRGVLGVSSGGTAAAGGEVPGSEPSAAAPAPPSASPSAPAEGAPVAVAGVRAMDPFGDSTENDDAAGRAADGDPATAWSSSTYTTAALGGLKRGVGLDVDLGGPQRVTAVDLAVAGTGGRVELRTSADGGYDGSEVVAAAEVGSGTGAPVTVELPEPVEAAHLLVWFTQLPQTGTGYSAQVAEVAVR